MTHRSSTDGKALAVEEKLRRIILRATSAQWPMLRKQEKQAALVAIEKDARELLRIVTQ